MPYFLYIVVLFPHVKTIVIQVSGQYVFQRIMKFVIELGTWYSEKHGN